jgi:hypothetical protein
LRLKKQNIIEMRPTLVFVPSKVTLARTVSGAPSQAVCRSFAIVAPGFPSAPGEAKGKAVQYRASGHHSHGGKAAAKAHPEGRRDDHRPRRGRGPRLRASGLRRVGDKSNEIAANLRSVDKLASLDLVKGRGLTLDAMRRQKEPAAKIIGLSGDYMFSLKANHPVLAYQVSAFFTDAVDKYPGSCKVQRCIAQERGGVVERRGIGSAAVSLDGAALERVTRASEWPGPGRLSGSEGVPGPPRGTAMATNETRYFITGVSRPAERLY